MLLAATGITASTYIKAYSTGTGGTGTYILNQSSANGSGTLTASYSSTSNNIIFGEWLQLQVPSAVNVYSFALYPSYATVNINYSLRTPSNFAILGSTNGTNWSLIHIAQNINWGSTPITQTVNVNSTSTFTYIRFVVMSLQGTLADQYLAINYLQYNSTTNVATATDSFTQYELSSISNSHFETIYSSNLPIQSCTQFIFTCQILLNNITDNYLNINFGATNTTGSNGVTFNFQTTPTPRINLFLNGTFVELNQSNSVSSTANSAWYNGSWDNVIIVYNKGTTSTWQMYLNGIQIYDISDPNNLGWVNDYAGNFVSINARTTTSRMNSYVRQINLRTSMPFEIVTPYTWYNCMTFTSLRSNTGLAYPWASGILGVDPNVQVQLSDNNSSQFVQQNNILFNQFPVQNYASFTLTLQFYYAFSGGNHMYVFFGANNTQTTSLTNQYSILIVSYNGYSNNGFSGNGVYLLNTAGTALAFFNTSFTQNAWNTFSVNYNRGASSTWNVTYNGTSCINYSDANNQQWINSSNVGNYWGIGASSNILTSYVRQVSMVVTPYTGSNSQKLLTPTTWYNNMTVASQGPNAWTAVQSGSDPLVQYQVCSSTLFSNGNNLYLNNPIQNNSSFVFQFEYYYNGQADNGCNIFFGSTTGNNYFSAATNGGITFNFQIFSTPGLQIYGPTGTLLSFTILNWLNQNNWIPVTITYTKGTVNTWVINHNGQYISYSDPNNTTWLNTQAGTYSGIGAHGGGSGSTTINSFIRKVQLSVVPGNTSTKFSQIQSVSGLTLNSLAPVVGMYIDIGNSSSYPGSGTTITDLSGNGYTYTMVNTPGYTSAGTASYLTFNGSNQYLSVVNSGYAFQSGSVTMEIWFSPSGNGILIDETNVPGSNTWKTSWIELSGGNILARVYNGTTLNLGSYTNGNWYQLVLTYDGITQRGYLNGLLVTSNLVTRSVANTNDMYYYFGFTDTTNLGNGGYFNGKLNSLIFYNTAISSQQVTLNFNRICSRFNLTPISVTSNPNINYFPMASTVSVSSRFNNTGSSGWMSFGGSVNSGNVVWTSGGGTTVGGVGTATSYSTTTPFAYNQAGGFTTTVSSTSYSGEWIQITCNPTIVNSFTLFPQPNSTFYTRMPSTFVLAGSNNGSTWTALHIVTNNITWTNINGITFTCNQNNTTSFTYFRLVITAVSGNNGYAGFGCLTLNTNVNTGGSTVTIPPTVMSASTLTVSGNNNSLLNGTYTASSSTNFGANPGYSAFGGTRTSVSNAWVTSDTVYTGGVYNGSFTISGISGTTGIITITTSATNNFVTGQYVYITGTNTTPSINGQNYLITFVSTTQFTISALVSSTGTIAGKVSYSTLVSGTFYTGEWLQLAVPFALNINSFTLQPQQTSTFLIEHQVPLS
jgi:hypothetical protein